MKAVADAYVDSRKPNKNFGRKRVLSLAPHTRAYLRFRTRRMPASVLRAKLFVYVTKGSGALNVSDVSRNWRERTVTYTRRPEASPPVAEAVVRTRGWTAIDVTGLVGFTRTVDLVLASVGDARLSIDSRESRARAPRLVIELGDPAVGAAGDIACDPRD